MLMNFDFNADPDSATQKCGSGSATLLSIYNVVHIWYLRNGTDHRSVLSFRNAKSHTQEFFKTCQLTCKVKDGNELSGQCRDPECSLRFLLRSERRHNIQLHFSGTILHSGNNHCLRNYIWALFHVKSVIIIGSKPEAGANPFFIEKP